MFGQNDPTQNIPEGRSRIRMCSLPDAGVKFFYTSPSGLIAVIFYIFETWSWLEHQETIPLLLVVRTLLLKRGNVSLSSTSEWPKCPFSQINTFDNSNLLSAQIYLNSQALNPAFLARFNPNFKICVLDAEINVFSSGFPFFFQYLLFPLH